MEEVDISISFLENGFLVSNGEPDQHLIR